MNNWIGRIATLVVLWALGTGIGIGVNWLVWRSTTCSGDRDHRNLECGATDHAYAFWSPWPLLLLWSVLVLGVLAWAMFSAAREDAEEASAGA